MNSGFRRAFLALTGFLISLVYLSPVMGAGYSEVFHSGKIDWSRWSAEAVGTMVIPAKNTKSEKAKAAAAKEAVKAARANLFDLVGRIKVDSATTIKDLLSQSDSLRNQVRTMVEKLTPKKVRISKNGRVEATLIMPMAGPLSELLLPAGIRAIDSVQPNIPHQEAPKEAFTGLVIECSGIRVRPAMFPSVFDEDGRLVYGSPYIHRDHAVKKGVAAYTRDQAAAAKDERVTPRPLVVKGIRVAASGPSDIVISNSDAGRVRGSAFHLKWLQDCRIIIVLE